MSLRPGDRVAAMTMFGGYASVVTAPADRAILIPEGVGFDAAAAVPVTYLTAWMLLVGLGRCRPGDAIYVESAAGGVGLACLDLAKALGLEVVAQASAGKHGVLRERGVRHVLAPDGPRLAEQVRAAAGGRGVDVAVLSRGGRHWGRMLPALAPGGRLAVIGTRIGGRRPWSALALAGEALGAPWLDLHPFALMRANRGVFGVNLHRLATEAPELVRRGADAVTAYWGEGMLRPEVDSRFAFEDAGRAHERLTSRANVGKVLLTP